MQIKNTLENLCICDIPLINTYIAMKSDYPMKNKGRYHCGALYTLKGTETYHFSDINISACPDSILIIPKNEEYSIELNDEESIVTTIDFELSTPFDFRPFCIKLNDTNKIKPLFSKALKEYKTKDTSSVLKLKSIFYEILSLLSEHEESYQYSGNYKKIAKAVEYMQNHFHEQDCTVRKIADMAGISLRYFEKLFFSKYKSTPKEYIISKKIELSKELLQSEKHSVASVAENSGFSNVYQFSKTFKLKTGYTPTEFRKTTKGL